jgi:hypothetical protein
MQHDVVGAGLQVLADPGTLWEEFEARYCQESIDRARACLGDAQFDRAYAQGIGLSLGGAVNLGLGQARPVLSVDVRQAVALEPVNNPPQDRRVNVVVLQPGRRNPGNL